VDEQRGERPELAGFSREVPEGVPAAARALHFNTLEDLRAFVADMLAEVRMQDAEGGPDPSSDSREEDCTRSG
jgi:hypothetical protein